MEHLIREFGAWLKQGFGWLVDVMVFGCLWGISQISRLLGTQWGSLPLLKIIVLALVLLLYAFYWVLGRFIAVIRWALNRIAYALGIILFSAAVSFRAYSPAQVWSRLWQSGRWVTSIWPRGEPPRGVADRARHYDALRVWA